MFSKAAWTIFYYILLRSILTKTQNYLAAIYLLLFCFTLLLIFYIYHNQISSLQVTGKGLRTPLSRWVQVFVCLCRCNLETYVFPLLDWCLGSQLREILISICWITLSSSREKTTQAQEVALLHISTAIQHASIIKFMEKRSSALSKMTWWRRSKLTHE